MCSLPVIVRVITKNKWIDFIAFPLVRTFMVHILDEIVIQKWYLIVDIKDYFYWMPIVWIGYLCAYYQVYEKVLIRLKGVNRWFFLLTILIVPMLRGIYSELFRLNLDVLYAPIFVLCLMMLLKEDGIGFRIWCILGKFSMYIWFLHALFFWDKTRSVLQPLIYGNNNIIVSMILLFGINLVLAIMVNAVLKKIGHAGKRIFAKL